MHHRRIYGSFEQAWGNDVPQESQAILDEFQGAMGAVPNLFRTDAPYPPLLRANWHKAKVALMEGELSRRVKEKRAYELARTAAARHFARRRGHGGGPFRQDRPDRD